MMSWFWLSNSDKLDLIRAALAKMEDEIMANFDRIDAGLADLKVSVDATKVLVEGLKAGGADQVKLDAVADAIAVQVDALNALNVPTV